MQTRNTFAALGCVLVLTCASLTAYAQGTTAPAGTAPAPAAAAPAPTTAERVAAIKASFAQSMANLKQYQWTETQVVNLKGEDKSNKQNTCYYGADGKVVKTPVAPPEEAKGKPGVRGKIIANKTEEMADYMQSAVALVKSYIPPDPAKIQAAKDAGKVSMTPLQGGKQARVDIKDYEKPGDDLGIMIDMTTNQILGLNVASYLTDATDAVTLNVTMGMLPDGTQYPSTILLNGVAKQIKVTTTNSGYEKKTN
jgi:Rieske Fe-S protein